MNASDLIIARRVMISIQDGVQIPTFESFLFNRAADFNVRTWVCFYDRCTALQEFNANMITFGEALTASFGND